MKTYILNILIAFDQVLNAIIGGWPDETLSSYSHRMYVNKKPWGWLRNVINALFWWQPDHCLQSYNAETLRRQLPPELR